MLELRQLPSLLTDCVIIGHGRRADVVLTRREFFAICWHMLNGNSPTFFLMPFRDEEAQPKYKKAFRADVRKRIPWVWDTITGKAKRPASVAFYPTNGEGKSRWAGMDFDAHDGNTARARDYALKAFAVVRQHPELFVTLTTSAGNVEHAGYHLYIFTCDFHSREDWIRLLKQVAALISAPIEDGICEIFPNESRGLPKAFSGPETWNPKNGDCGLILHQNLTRSFLPSLPYGRERDGIALPVLCELPSRNGPSSQSRELFRGELGAWKHEFAITAPSARHEKLTKLIGYGFFQAGREVVRKNAELQHREANPPPRATLEEHLREFDKAWFGWERKWLAGLSTAERHKYDALMTQEQRDAFRIIRNWSKADKDSPDEFKIRAQSLADRIGISLSWACKLRRRFCEAGILHETKPFVANSLCARFRWTATDGQKGRQSTLISPSRWNGDPGDVRLASRGPK